MNSIPLRDLQVHLKTLLSESGGIELTLDELAGRLANGPRFNQFTSLKARYRTAKSDFLGGKIPYRDGFDNIASQVRDGLMDLIDSLQIADLRQAEESDEFFKSLLTLMLDLDRATQPVYLVNCDRTAATRDFRAAAREKRDLPLHFCLVLACPFQTPHSFAERLVLDEMVRLEADPDARPYVKRRDESRLLIPALPVELDAEESLDAFRRDFARYHADFFQKKQQYTQAAFAFALHEKNWDDFLPEYIERVAHWLRENARQARQRHLFFLVLYVENLHRPERLLPSQTAKNEQLLALARKHPDWMTGLSALPAVPADEIEKWLHKVSLNGFAPSAPEVLARFTEWVEHSAPNRFHGATEFDMFDVEKIQAMIHRLAKTIAHQQVQSNL